jgi:EmrB/QacA subfamily drug resistance transporter
MKHQETYPNSIYPPLPKDPSSHRRDLALATLCMAVLIAQIDTAVVNLAVGPIAAYFRASVAAMQWVVDSYNLVYAILLLTGGLLADLYGRKRVFMAGIAIFTAASLLCGFSSNVALLVAGRTLAGAGAALMTPASLAILRVVWPDGKQRGRALGIWAACNGLAFAIAPTLGGLSIKWFGWRSIFFLVVPVGLLALALAIPAIPESSNPEKRHFDPGAQVLGALALGGLAIAAIETNHDRTAALGALIIAILSLLLFIRVETAKGSTAMVPLDMFRAPAFRGAIVATAGMTFGMYGVLFLLPLIWQTQGTFSATQAGLALMPMALVFLLMSPLTGKLAEKTGVRRLACGGVAMIGCGLLVLGVTAEWTSLAYAESGLLLAGAGMGLATGPLMGMAMGAVSAARSGTASALINVARIAGATLGVAILGALFASAGTPVAGLRFAMLLGGSIQIACAAVTWHTTRPATEPGKDQATADST